MGKIFFALGQGAWFSHSWRHWLYKEDKVIVSAHGVQFICCGRNESIAWGQISSTTIDAESGELRLTDDRGATVYSVRVRLIDGLRFAERLVKLIEEKREVYRSLESTPPPN